jgi:hypothetical protein
MSDERPREFTTRLMGSPSGGKSQEKDPTYPTSKSRSKASAPAMTTQGVVKRADNAWASSWTPVEGLARMHTNANGD